MKALAVLAMLIFAQALAAAVMFILGYGWLALDPGIVNEVLPAMVIGLLAVAVSLLPFSAFRRGRNG